MNSKELNYLKEVLGNKESSKYKKIEPEKLELILNLLKNTSLKEQLNHDELFDFCQKIAFGKYGKTLIMILCYIELIPKDKRKQNEYKQLVKIYRTEGYNNQTGYLNTFEYFKISEITNRQEFDFQTFEKLIHQEIDEVKQKENASSLKMLKKLKLSK